MNVIGASMAIRGQVSVIGARFTFRLGGLDHAVISSSVQK